MHFGPAYGPELGGHGVARPALDHVGRAAGGHDMAGLQREAPGAQVVGEPDHDVPRVAEHVGSCALAHHLAAHAHHRPAGAARSCVEARLAAAGPSAEQAADGVVGDQVRGLHGEPVAVARIRNLDGGVDARDRGPDLGLRIGRGAGPKRAAHDEVELRLDGVEVHAASPAPAAGSRPRNRRTDAAGEGSVHAEARLHLRVGGADLVARDPEARALHQPVLHGVGVGHRLRPARGWQRVDLPAARARPPTAARRRVPCVPRASRATLLDPSRLSSWSRGRSPRIMRPARVPRGTGVHQVQEIAEEARRRRGSRGEGAERRLAAEQDAVGVVEVARAAVGGAEAHSHTTLRCRGCLFSPSPGGCVACHVETSQSGSVTALARVR